MGKLSITTPTRLPSRPFTVALSLVFTLVYSLILAASAPAQSIPATTIPLLHPAAIVYDPLGNLYLAESGNHRIRQVDTTGHITTLAGTATQGFSGDHGPATAAQLDSPQGLALNPITHTLYLADTHNQRIRAINLLTGIIVTVAGTGTPGFSGDSAPAIAATLNFPTAIALDSHGNLYLADSANHRIRRIDTATGIITTIAGNGTQGFSGDQGPATAAALDSPSSLAFDPSGNLYLADTHNHRIRRIDATTGRIATVAGNGTPGFSGDQSLATQSTLALPTGLATDSSGNLYLADSANQRIRRIDTASGLITTVAGQGTQTFRGASASATIASLDTPRATSLSPSGLLTLSDTGNQRIRQIAPDHTLATIAGLGLTIPGALTLAAPAVSPYGTGTLTATLTASTAATGPITVLDTTGTITTQLGTAPLTANTATLSLATLHPGTHTLVATYPGDQSHTPAQSPALNLTITPAAVLATLTTPTTQPLSLTTHITSTTSGVPTGTIAFLDATTPLANIPLDPTGTATINPTTLLAGTHTLTARYSGDFNFLPATTSPLTLTIAPTAPTTPSDFTLTPTTATTQTVLAGTAATYTFTTLTQGPPLSSPIVLSASGLPTAATASFSPAYLPPGASTSTFTLTITTPKNALAGQKSHPSALASSLLAFLLLPLLAPLRSPRNLRALLVLCLAASLTLGCGNRINTNGLAQTAPRSYPITVSATATTPTGSALQHTATVTLIIQ